MLLWAPADVPTMGTVPHAMTADDIAELLEGYRRAALNVSRTAADGVEVHAAHGYLLGEFLSPHLKPARGLLRRAAGLEQRTHLLLEAVSTVKEGLGDDRVVGIRMNGSDLTPPGCDQRRLRGRRAPARGERDGGLPQHNRRNRRRR